MPNHIIRSCIVSCVKPYELVAALMAQEGIGALPLAKRLGQPKLQPQLHRFINGEVSSPRSTTAAPLAAYFGLPLEAIYDEKVATEEARARGLLTSGVTVGEAAPRPYHKAPAPVLDNIEPGPDIKGQVPVISWVQAGPWSESCSVLDLDEVERWLLCPIPHSKCTAALRVRGDSMTAPLGAARTYPEGSFIFVDFERRSPVNGQRIVAKIEGDDMVTFKTFKHEDGRKWLQPLNPMHQPIYDKFKVLGTVIGTWLDE